MGGIAKGEDPRLGAIIENLLGTIAERTVTKAERTGTTV